MADTFVSSVYLPQTTQLFSRKSAQTGAVQQVLGCSVSYRIAIGPQQGRKVSTLQTIPAWENDDRFAQVEKESGFSLHAGVAAQAWERWKLERLCRYISRPVVSDTPITDTLGQYSLSTQNALQRWDHARHLRAAGFYRQASGAGAETESEPDPVPGVFAPNSKHREVSH